MLDADFERELVEALPLMEKTASAYLRRGDDRKDVVQEAALRAWANRNQFRGDSKFSAWAHTIVRNVVLEMHRRKHAGCRAQEVSMPNLFDAVDDKRMTMHEDWPVVERLLPTLPKPMQVAVNIRLKGLNAGPTSTNKVRYYRAILILRARLGGKREDAAFSKKKQMRPSMHYRERTSAIGY
jgi:RNA polymerase sigma factor (sigma-70 family)